MAWVERTTEPSDPAALRAAAQRAEPVALAREQILPVSSGLEQIVAGPGLRRGSTLAVTGTVGVESVVLALAVEASQQGSWSALVGLPSLGLVAAGQLGVALDRVAVIDAPSPSSWGTVMAALVDGFDLILCDARPDRRARSFPVRQAERLMARARERGAVLMLVGGAGGHSWPTAADVEVRITAAEWSGLGAGHGYLRARTLTLEATGRRGAARMRRVEVQLPDADGRLCVPRTPEQPDSSGDRRFTVVAS